MRRVVITGMGVVSPIGNSIDDVKTSLYNGTSGIRKEEEYTEHGFRSQVAGIPQIDLTEHIDKRDLRFMGPGAAYNFIAMEQAIADAGLEKADVSNPRTGLIMGSGGPSTSNFLLAHNTVIQKGSPKRMGPFMVTRCMSSTNSA
ncbi:MAG: beta-ketoacyl synthase N-terminal-like domain-containing protein, partial [Pseudomonadota bacterium]